MKLKMFIAAIIGIVLLSGTAIAGDYANEKILNSTNNIRANHGLREYKVGPVISRIAQKHSAELAKAQDLYHNSRLGRQVPNWSILGENVGYGPDWRSVQIAFMDSKGHRANILSTDYRKIGIGSTRDKHGTLWVVVVFKKPME